MKVLSQNIEVICHFDKVGKIKPIRFKIEEDSGCKVIKIEKIITTDLQKQCGNRVYVFTCMVVIDGIQKICEIKYIIEDCRWLLFKI